MSLTSDMVSSNIYMYDKRSDKTNSGFLIEGFLTPLYTMYIFRCIFVL